MKNQVKNWKNSKLKMIFKKMIIDLKFKNKDRKNKRNNWQVLKKVIK